MKKWNWATDQQPQPPASNSTKSPLNLERNVVFMFWSRLNCSFVFFFTFIRHWENCRPKAKKGVQKTAQYASLFSGLLFCPTTAYSDLVSNVRCIGRFSMHLWINIGLYIRHTKRDYPIVVRIQFFGLPFCVSTSHNNWALFNFWCFRLAFIS